MKFFFSNGSSVVGLIQGGKVKAIAHTGKGRLESLPDIPPVSDTLPGFEAYEWNGVFVPHGTPAAIVQKLNAALNAALRSPEVTDALPAAQHRFAARTRRRNSTLVEDQMKLWSGVVKEAKSSWVEPLAHEPPHIAGPVAHPKAPREKPPAGAWDTHAQSSGRPTNSPTRRGAATRRPTRRSRTSSRCSITTAASMASSCRATRTATTTASCSTRYRAIRSGCAASPSPTRASSRKRCATGTRLGMRGLRFHLFRRKKKLCARRRARRVRGIPQDHGRAQLGHADFLRLGVYCRILAPTLREIAREMPVIVDHYRMMAAARGVNDPNFQALLKLVGEGHAHVKAVGALPHLHAISRLSRRAAAARGAGARQSGAADVGHRLAAPQIDAAVMPDDGHCWISV